MPSLYAKSLDIAKPLCQATCMTATTSPQATGPTAYEVHAAADTTHRMWQRTRSTATRRVQLRALVALTATLCAATALFAALTIGALS
jgi:hypothetical protein